MQEITLKELSEKTGRPSATIRQDIVRGKLIKSGRGKVNLHAPETIAYLGKYAPDAVPETPEVLPVPKDVPPIPNTEGIPTTREVDEIKRQFKVQAEMFSDIPNLGDPRYNDYLKTLGEQGLKEEKIRREIIMGEQRDLYTRNQAQLSETKRRKLEGDLIEADWVVATVGHSIKMYKKEILQAVETQVSTIFSEHGIDGEDKTRYLEDLRASLAAAEKLYKNGLIKTVEDYRPDRLNVVE